jgi:2-polyprenyl-3-methyl-5-hydroxy-6-metoxy-1,4-benzoquinol methylase
VVFDEFIRWTLGAERGALATVLTVEERAAFLAYYAGLPDPGDEAAVRRYLRGLWHSDIGWVARWISERASRRPAGTGAMRVLDAGSGFGTLSMLYACMGAEVTAVDLSEERVKVSRRRLELFERRTRRLLPVRFERVDVTEDIESRHDLVWVYNAISHIDPVERFLQRVVRHLTPRGALVIGDLNGGNSACTRRLDAMRAEVHGSFTDSDGVVHRYANERVFSPPELRRILRENGFEIEHHELLARGSSRIPEALQGPLRLAARVPWLSQRLARRQFVVARTSWRIVKEAGPTDGAVASRRARSARSRYRARP